MLEEPQKISTTAVMEEVATMDRWDKDSDIIMDNSGSINMKKILENNHQKRYKKLVYRLRCCTEAAKNLASTTSKTIITFEQGTRPDSSPKKQRMKGILNKLRQGTDILHELHHELNMTAPLIAYNTILNTWKTYASMVDTDNNNHNHNHNNKKKMKEKRDDKALGQWLYAAEQANQLVQNMTDQGVIPDVITYSTLVALWSSVPPAYHHHPYHPKEAIRSQHQHPSNTNDSSSNNNNNNKMPPQEPQPAPPLQRTTSAVVVTTPVVLRAVQEVERILPYLVQAQVRTQQAFVVDVATKTKDEDEDDGNGNNRDKKTTATRFQQVDGKLYVSLLKAYGNAGLYDKAWSLFERLDSASSATVPPLSFSSSSSSSSSNPHDTTDPNLPNNNNVDTAVNTASEMCIGLDGYTIRNSLDCYVVL